MECNYVIKLLWSTQWGFFCGGGIISLLFFFTPEIIADVYSETFVNVLKTFIRFLPRHMSTFRFITFFFFKCQKEKSIPQENVLTQFSFICVLLTWGHGWLTAIGQHHSYWVPSVTASVRSWRGVRFLLKYCYCCRLLPWTSSLTTTSVAEMVAKSFRSVDGPATSVRAAHIWKYEQVRFGL